MITRPIFDCVYLQVADVISQRSTCLRQKVGAVIVVDNRIVSHGYNGVGSGDVHCCDTGKCLKDAAKNENYKICFHAEQNAICQAAKRGIAINSGTLYVNAEICLTCAKLVTASGITKVVFRLYRISESDVLEMMRVVSTDGMRFLDEHNVQMEVF